MKYQKPEIAVLDSALKAIQGNNKLCSSVIDSDRTVTVGAYESDE